MNKKLVRTINILKWSMFWGLFSALLTPRILFGDFYFDYNEIFSSFAITIFLFLIFHRTLLTALKKARDISWMKKILVFFIAVFFVLIQAQMYFNLVEHSSIVKDLILSSSSFLTISYDFMKYLLLILTFCFLQAGFYYLISYGIYQFSACFHKEKMSKKLKWITLIVFTFYILFFLYILFGKNCNAFSFPINSQGIWVNNALFQFDSASVILNVDSFNIRHLLYPIVTLPFQVISSFLGVIGYVVALPFFGFISFDKVYGMALGITQIVVLILSLYLLYYILKKNFSKRFSIVGTVAFAFISASMLSTLVVERWIYSTFFSLLLLYSFLYLKNRKLNLVLILMNAYTITTSAVMYLFQMIQEKFTWKKFRRDLLFLILISIGCLLIAGKSYLILDFFKDIGTNIQIYSGTEVTFLDKVVQFFGMISNIFLIPSHQISENFVQFDSYLYNAVVYHYELIIGLLIFIAATIGFIKNRKNLIVQCSMTFVIFSFVLLVIIGYGASQHEMSLYIGYFSWAYYLLILFFLSSFIKHNVVKVVLTCCFLGMITFNIGSMLKIVDELSNEFHVRNTQEEVMLEEDFYLFGMGNRKKIMYEDNRLRYLDTFETILHFDESCQITLKPEEYVLKASCGLDDYLVYETSKGVYYRLNDKEYVLTESFVNLKSFQTFENRSYLRILQHDILINIKDGIAYPNFIVYDDIWYRDIAIMAHFLEYSDNVFLIEDWINSITEVYDESNGEKEADNLGEILYLLSLTDQDHSKMIQKVLDEAKRITENNAIVGKTNQGVHPVYQTKWLKYGMNKLGIPNDSYVIPNEYDSYSSLFWMDYKSEHVNGPYFPNALVVKYPYLLFAEANFYKKNVPIELKYPLTYEKGASKANYENLRILNYKFADQKISYSHGWHATEMFFYLLEKEN